MKFVLVGLVRSSAPEERQGMQGLDLEVTQLREVLPTLFQFTYEWFAAFVHHAMGAHVTSLSEPFATYVARVRSLARVSSLMSYHRQRHVSNGFQIVLFRLPS